MHVDNTYCHRCGERLGEREVGGRLRPSCASCGETVFLDPKVAVAVVATDDGEILMVKRDIDPMMGRWSLPAGYVDRGEVVEEAAVREVREETGVEIRLDSLLGVYSRRALRSYWSCTRRRSPPGSPVRVTRHRTWPTSQPTVCLRCPFLTMTRSCGTGGSGLPRDRVQERDRHHCGLYAGEYRPNHAAHESEALADAREEQPSARGGKLVVVTGDRQHLEKIGLGPRHVPQHQVDLGAD